MYFFDFPVPLSGEPKLDLDVLWLEYWKLIEQLKRLNEDLNAKYSGGEESTSAAAKASQYGTGEAGTASGSGSGCNCESKAERASVPTSASIDEAGLISFKNSSGKTLFTLQLPLYTGGTG